MQNPELPPTGTMKILRLSLEASIPVGREAVGRLRFVDEGPQNVVAFFGYSHTPERMECEIRIGEATNPRFRRGDANADGSVDIADAIATLGALFTGEGAILCNDAADSNDDGIVNISDAVATLGYKFGGDGPLPTPGAESCGFDTTDDDLTCRWDSPCDP